MIRVATMLVFLVSLGGGCRLLAGYDPGEQPRDAAVVPADHLLGEQPFDADVDAGPNDGARADATSEDSAPTDAAPEDSTPTDAAFDDSTPTDAAFDDSAPVDAAVDSGVGDAGPSPDAGPPTITLHRTFGNSTFETVAGVATDSAGNVFVIGGFRGTINVGSQTVKCSGSTTTDDIYIASLTPSGTVRWATCFGGSTADRGLGIAVDSKDRVLVTGSYTGLADFKTAILAANGASDIFVARLSNAGKVEWARPFGGSGLDFGYGIATDSKDRISVAAAFSASITLGPVKHTVTNPTTTNALLIALDEQGVVRWSKTPGAGEGRALVVDATDNIYYTGGFLVAGNFGGGNVSAAGGTSADIFVASYTTTGAYRWARTFGAASKVDQGQAITLSGPAAIAVAGTFAGSMTIKTPLAPDGPTDSFIVRLAQSDGTPLWATRVGGDAAGDAALAIIERGGELVATGSYGGALTAASSAKLHSAFGKTDVWLAAFDPSSGALSWSRSIGGSSDDVGSALASHGAMLVLGGTFSATVDFGTGPVTAKGANDGFLVWLGP